MNLILIGIAGVVGYIAGFIACALHVKEIRKVDEIAHNNLIKRKNDEIFRLRKSNNELQQNNNELQQNNNELQKRNAAQIDAFDRATGNNHDYFKPF